MDEEQNKFYKYIDDKSILVITSKNRLIRIHCPFRVKDREGELHQVDAIVGIIYIKYKIDGKYHLHHTFTILN